MSKGQGLLKATVGYNGHRYVGHVVKQSGVLGHPERTKALVRFATGSGKTRERSMHVVATLAEVRSGSCYLHEEGAEPIASTTMEYMLCMHEKVATRHSYSQGGGTMAAPTKRRYCAKCGEALDKKWTPDPEMADKRHPVVEGIHQVELISGSGKEAAVMTAGAFAVFKAACSWGCCAHHGEGPEFPCCRCGATWRSVLVVDGQPVTHVGPRGPA